MTTNFGNANSIDHEVGNRAILQQIAQTALDLYYDQLTG